MNRLTATADITNEFDEVILPAGTILERRGDHYEGVNPQTGNKIKMHASWAENEVYMEYLVMEGDEV